jgi:hypothetical protein
MAIKDTIQANPEFISNFIQFSEFSRDDLIALADHPWVDEADNNHIVLEADSSKAQILEIRQLVLS